VDSEIAALRSAIQAADSIIVASHINPDGDAVGSSLALLMGIESLGKKATVILNDPVPMNLRFLPGWERIRGPEAVPLGAGLGIIADVGVMSRLGRARPSVEAAAHLCVIDHHEPDGAPPGDIRIIDTGASATCLILYRMLPTIGVEISPAIAQCLLTGIATDTGSFRFRNTDPATLDAASHLVALGGDLAQINEEVWEKKPLSAVKLLRFALDNLELYASGRVAVSRLTQSNYQEASASDEDSEGIVNEISRINTAQIAAMFREPKPGRVRVSVRSRGELDIAAVCRQFGGGGHVNAAGCTFESSIDDAIRTLVPALEACLASS
jgi:phosphoesterase RecJ-like protein